MKKRRFITIIMFLILVCSGAGYWYFGIYQPIHTTFDQVTDKPIPLNNSDNIYFYSEGFAVSGDTTRFYSLEGVPVISPLSQKNISDLGSSYSITQSTPHYMVVDHHLLVDTTRTPFKLVLDLNGAELWDLKEYPSYLLILLKDSDGQILPYTIDFNGNKALEFDGMGDTVFLDADYDPTEEGLSILTTDDTGALPSTRVFHYTKPNSPYGALSLEDKLSYKIFRFPDQFVLVGSQEIMCYNMEGTQKWVLKIPQAYDHLSLQTEDGLLLYFNEVSVDGTSANGLFINPSGDYRLLQIPKGIRQLESFNRSLVGLDPSQNNLVFLKMNGDIVRKIPMPADVKSIYVTPFSDDLIYVRSSNHKLYIYSTKPRKENSK